MVLNKKNFMRPVCTPGSTTKTSREVSTSTKMKVYIRVRPYNDREESASFRSIIKLVDDRMLIFDPRENDQPFFFRGVKQRMRDVTKKQNKEMQFVFDRVYGSESTNEDVFTNSICGIFGPLLEGYNCSVFVYGATGAGKTFTMLGNEYTAGIIYLTMRSLFEKIEEVQDRHFDIGISYLEVYNENVHDLLNPSSGPLHLREDTVNGVIVAGMKLVQIVDAEHLFELLRQGNSNRTQHPTDANAESSRSHAVFQVFIKMQSKSCGKVQLVKLSMIDLAGSERGAATNCKGLRFKEGANINKSLLALGNCINNLADGVRHIPYRDSKLTRLLKDSLGGNCQTVMIACVGPTTISYEDTYNTLKYAARARTIKTKIAKTVLSMDSHIGHYKVLIQEKDARIVALEQENADLRKLAGQPRTGDLTSWIEKFSSLYCTKKEIHKSILTLESSEKVTKWRINYKHGNAERVHAFDNSDDEDVNRLETQVNRMEGALSGIHKRINELWERKIQVDENLATLHEEIVAQNLTEAVAAEVAQQKAAISEIEASIQIEHLRKLLNLLDKTNVSQQDIITKMTEQYNQHHNLLRGYNKVTNSMAGERKDIKSMLKGKNTISWEISPTSEVRKRSETLKKYASLSIDLLQTDQKPCPLILQDLEEDVPTEQSAPTEVVLSPEIEKSDADTNTTFTMTEVSAATPSVAKPTATNRMNDTFTKPLKSPRCTPLQMKKGSMKENVRLLPTGSKRTALPYIPLRKTATTTPIFKTPKVPLAAKNQNVK